MELKDLLGEELYSQVDAKIQEHNGNEPDKLKHVRFADLSEGNYISKEKLVGLQTEVGGYKKQLEEAHNQIQSYKNMNIDEIKQSVETWKSKYETDTQSLKEQMANQEKMFAAEKYLDGQKIRSPLSKKAIMDEFLKQNMEFKDGTFVGADDYMKQVKEKYPDEFEKEEPKEEKKVFVRGTAHTYKPKTKDEQEAYRQNKYGKNKYYQED